VAAPGNIPGGRDTASSWVDSSGNLWLFGGLVVDFPGNPLNPNSIIYYNDLWEAIPGSAAPATTPTPAITTTATSNPGVFTVTVSDSNSAAAIYYVDQTGATVSTSSSQYIGPITVGPVTAASTNSTTSVVPIQAIAVAPNFLPSAVATASVALPVQTFTLTMPTTLTVAAGSSVNAIITVTPVNGYNQQIGFTCWNLPIAATCAFSPQTVIPSATGSTTTQITVTVPVTSASKSSPLLPGAALAALVCCLGWKRQRKWLRLLLVCACLAGLTLISACGGGGGNGGSGKSYQFLVYGQTGQLLVPVNFQLTVK
jgi:hypothetical protein